MANTNIPISFRTGDSANLSSQPRKDGALYFTTDRKIYFDYFDDDDSSGQRLKMSDMEELEKKPGELKDSGSAYFNDKVYVGGTLDDVDNWDPTDVETQASLHVSGTTHLNEHLYVNQGATIDGDLRVGEGKTGSSGLHVQGGAEITDSVILGNDLTVDGRATFAETIRAKRNIEVDGKISAKGTISTDNQITFKPNTNRREKIKLSDALNEALDFTFKNRTSINSEDVSATISNSAEDTFALRLRNAVQLLQTSWFTGITIAIPSGLYTYNDATMVSYYGSILIKGIGKEISSIELTKNESITTAVFDLQSGESGSLSLSRLNINGNGRHLINPYDSEEAADWQDIVLQNCNISNCIIAPQQAQKIIIDNCTLDGVIFMGSTKRLLVSNSSFTPSTFTSLAVTDYQNFNNCNETIYTDKNGLIHGTITHAEKWVDPRQLKIGATGYDVDGSDDVEWTAAAITGISTATGIAPLIENKIPASYLPSYVDDIIEGTYDSKDGKFYNKDSSAVDGEPGKIYVDIATTYTYRWTGTAFVLVTTGPLVLGKVAGTAVDWTDFNNHVQEFNNFINNGGTLGGNLEITNGGNLKISTNDTNYAELSRNSLKFTYDSGNSEIQVGNDGRFLFNKGIEITDGTSRFGAILPKTTLSHTLGAKSNLWTQVWAREICISATTGSDVQLSINSVYGIIPSSVGALLLGTIYRPWKVVSTKKLYSDQVYNSKYYGSYTVNEQNQVTNEPELAFTIDDAGVTTFNKDVTFNQAISTMGVATFNNGISVTGASTFNSSLSVADQLTVSGLFVLNHNLIITGHILPNVNSAYNLGSAYQQWKEIHGDQLLVGNHLKLFAEIFDTENQWSRGTISFYNSAGAWAVAQRATSEFVISYASVDANAAVKSAEFKFLALNGLSSFITPTLTINSAEQTSHLTFSHADANYITAPNGSSIAFILDGAAPALDHSSLTVTKTGIYSGKAVAIGSKDSPWGAIYSQSNYYTTATGRGYFLTDSTGYSYPGIYNNNKNLWIGAIAGTSTHHTGFTYISTGYNKDESAGNGTILLAIPNAENNDASYYGVFHGGYLDVSKATTGTLAVARGGTGITTNPSMLVNLGSATADTVFEATPRPGVTGTLGLGHGGTGAITAAAARTNLSVPAMGGYNDNIDNLITTGFYRLSGAAVTTKSDGTTASSTSTSGHIPYGQLIVSRGGNSNDTIAQILCPYNDNTLHVRTGNPAAVGGNGSYSDWAKMLTDKNYSNYALPLSGGTMTGNIIMPGNNSYSIKPATNNTGSIGTSAAKFNAMYATTFHGDLNGTTAHDKTYTLAVGATVDITWTDIASAIIVCQPQQTNIRSTFVYTGYGDGGPTRSRLQILNKSEQIVAQVLPATTGKHGIRITNNASYAIKIFISHIGSYPTPTFTSTTTQAVEGDGLGWLVDGTNQGTAAPTSTTPGAKIKGALYFQII